MSIFMNKLDLLEVNNLSVYFQTEYGLVNAVDDVSYTIKNGETLALAQNTTPKIMLGTNAKFQIGFKN